MLTPEDKQALLDIRERWSWYTLLDWMKDGVWDELMGEGLPNDDWGYIQENYKFNITVEEK